MNTVWSFRSPYLQTWASFLTPLSIVFLICNKSKKILFHMIIMRIKQVNTYQVHRTVLLAHVSMQKSTLYYFKPLMLFSL